MSGLNCRTLKLPVFVSDEKPGSLYRVAINADPETAVFFPQGCRESYFIINDTDSDAVRGGHVHGIGTKAEIFVAVQGRAHVVYHSPDGCGDISLESPEHGLCIPPGVWHSVRLTPGSILVVYASVTIEEDNTTTDAKPCSCPS